MKNEVVVGDVLVKCCVLCVVLWGLWGVVLWGVGEKML